MPGCSTRPTAREFKSHSPIPFLRFKLQGRAQSNPLIGFIVFRRWDVPSNRKGGEPVDPSRFSGSPKWADTFGRPPSSNGYNGRIAGRETRTNAREECHEHKGFSVGFGTGFNGLIGLARGRSGTFPGWNLSREPRRGHLGFEHDAGAGTNEPVHHRSIGTGNRAAKRPT